MIRVSASKLSLLLRCLGPAWLETVQSSSQASRRGVELHAHCERVSNGMALGKSLAMVPDEWRDDAAKIPVDAIPLHMSAEVAFAFNPRTGAARELGRGLGRDYSQATEDEIVGTADLVGVTDDSVVVADLKFGRSFVEGPGTNPQFLFLGLCAAKVYEKPYADLMLIKCRDDDAFISEARVDAALDLGTFAAKLRWLRVALDEIAKGKHPSLHEGEHCRYCPAQLSCPAKVAMVRRMADGTEAQELVTLRLATVDDVARAYKRAKMVHETAGKILSACHAATAALGQDVDLGDGWVLGEYTKKGRDQLDGDIVWQVLKETYGSDVADQAIKRVATKAALKEAIKGAVQKGKAAEAERKVMAEIDSRGGLERKDVTTVGIHRKQLKKGAA